MTMIRLVVGVLALAITAGCSAMDDDVRVTPVPADCEPTDDRLTWSPPQTTTILTNATLYKPGDLATGKTGTSLLNQPFVPSISGIEASERWLTKLGESLARHTEKPVHTTPPASERMSSGFSAGEGHTPMVLYTGVDKVVAEFEARCEPTVQGTLNAWSRTETSGVSCDFPPSPTLGILGHMALELCPGGVAPAPSQPVDAAEFKSDPRSDN